MSLKKLLTAIVTVSMVFSLVVPAVSADAASDLLAAAIGRMKGFGIVQGNQDGDLKLGDTITRAEIMKVLVTAAGKGDDAQLLRGAPAFSDTQAHWASGYVALAKAMGYTIGYPDGTFRPDNKITYGEIITLVVRAVGLDVSTQAYTWPNNYIHAAMDAGVIPPGIDATKVAGDFAIRSYVFLLADQAFLTVKLPSGKTTYQTHFVTVPPTLTVDQGASLSTSKDMVTISGSTNGISVTVGGAAAELTNGTFSTDVSVKLGSSTVAVVASDAVGNTTTVNVAVTRAPAAAASISVDLPASVTAGSETAVTATVKDSYGNEIADAVVTGTCDAAVGTYDEATGKLTAAQAVGSGNCSFTSGAATTGDQAVSVVAGELASLAITGNTSMSSSGRQQFTATGADQYGNPVSTGTVTWSASAGVIDQSGNYAPGGIPGTAVTITATAGSLSATKTVTVYGTADHVVLTIGTNNIVANGGSTTTVTATVVDTAGNPVADFSGTVSFSITNATVAYFGTTAGTASTSATAANGVASVTMTAGSAVGSALISATTPSGKSANATLTTVAPAFTGLTMTASPATIGNDGLSTSTITIKAVDQGGVALASLTKTVVVTLQSSNTAVAQLSGSTVSVTLGSNGQGQATVYASTAAGSTTISATSVTVDSSASSLAPAPVTINTTPVYAPAKLSVDSISTVKAVASGIQGDTNVTAIKVRILDANGNQVTTPSYYTGSYPNVTVKLASSDTTAAIASGPVVSTGYSKTAVSGDQGSATFYVYNPTAGTVTWTITGTYNINATTSVTLASTSATSVFTPGSPTSVALSFNPAHLAANGTQTGTLTATISDSNGNAVTDGSYAVTFKRPANPTSCSSCAITSWTGDQVVNSANGTASVTLTASTNQASDVFTASITVSGVTYPSGNQTVATKILGASNALDVGSITSDNSFKAGSTTTIKINVNDATPEINVLDNSSVVTLSLTGKTSATTQTWTATAVNGVAKFTASLTSAEIYDLEATATGLTKVTSTSAVTIDPASAASIKVSATSGQPTTISADGSSTLNLTASSADQYGNAIGTLNGTVNWTTNVSGVVSLSSTTAPTTNATASTTPGVVTLTAAQGTLTSGSLTITTVGTLAPSGLQVTVGSAKTVASGVSGTPQTVTVNVIDANGNRVTNASTFGAQIQLFQGSGTSAVFVGPGGNTAGAFNPYTVQATDLGSATFRVYNAVAETVTYTAKLINLAGQPSASGTGSFNPGNIASISVADASPAAVASDGTSIATVTAKILDGLDNTVTGATGSLKFSLTDGQNYGYLQGADAQGTVTVALSGGSATAVLQSKSNATAVDFLAVKAECVGCTNADATTFTGSNTNTEALYVFGTADQTAPNFSTSTATYVYNNGTVTATFVFAIPVRVTLASANGYLTLGGFNGTAGDLANATFAQGSDAYTVTATWSNVTPGAGAVTATSSNSVNAAVYGYNNVAASGTKNPVSP